MIIYKITNVVNGDFYIGKTRHTMEERFSKHKYSTKYEKSKETHLCRAMRKYGLDAFIIEALETQVPENTLEEREMFWIEKLNPPYNMTAGGDGGDTSQSPKFISAMKEYHSNKPREEYATYGMLGKKQSQKFRDAIQKSNSYPVVCEGKEFPSIKAADEYYRSLGTPKSIRKRIDNPKHTDWYRVRPKISRPKRHSPSL